MMITCDPNPRGAGIRASSVKGYVRNQCPHRLVLDISSLHLVSNARVDPACTHLLSFHILVSVTYTRKPPFFYKLGNSGIRVQFPCHIQELRYENMEISHFSLVF